MAFDVQKEVLKNPKKIVDYLTLRENDYFKSQVFIKLKRKSKRALDSYNMNFNNTNKSTSNISFPLVKEQQLLRRAVTKRNFRSNPLITLEATGDTPQENADNMQDLLMLNLKNTKFRKKTFDPLINNASIYGVGVMYQTYEQDNVEHMKTVQTDLGFERVKVATGKKLIQHYNVHHLNYFQDASCLNANEADFQGHIDEIRLDQLTALIDDDNNNQYIKKNVQAVIKDAQNNGAENDNYFKDNKEDENSQAIHLVRYYTTLAFKGNEMNPSKFYIERVGDKIIRIQEEIYDNGISPYTIFLFDKHVSYWWGLADAEYKTPHENFTNLLYNVAADNVLQSTQRLKLYDPESISIKSINNMQKNNGWVKTDLKGTRSIKDIVNEFQPQDNSLNGVQFIMQAINQSAQSISTKTDLQKTAGQGGPANTTATAAGIIAGQGDLLDSDIEETFSYALSEMAMKDVVMLQQFTSDQIRLRADSKSQARVIDKSEILGEYDYIAKTSMQTNSIAEGQRIQNAITQLINMANSGRPEFANMNTVDAVKDWIQTLDIGDPDKIMPDVVDQQGLDPNLALPPQPQPQGGVNAQIA